MQADHLQCKQEANTIEAALLKLMRTNHDAGFVCISQKGKDANYFQVFVCLFIFALVCFLKWLHSTLPLLFSLIIIKTIILFLPIIPLI